MRCTEPNSFKILPLLPNTHLPSTWPQFHLTSVVCFCAQRSVTLLLKYSYLYILMSIDLWYTKRNINWWDTVKKDIRYSEDTRVTQKSIQYTHFPLITCNSMYIHLTHPVLGHTKGILCLISSTFSQREKKRGRSNFQHTERERITSSALKRFQLDENCSKG